MNLKWIGPLALLAALVIGDQIRINRPGHKYRLTVEVETPEGVRAGASSRSRRIAATDAADIQAPQATPSSSISAAAVTRGILAKLPRLNQPDSANAATTALRAAELPGVDTIDAKEAFTRK